MKAGNRQSMDHGLVTNGAASVAKSFPLYSNRNTGEVICVSQKGSKWPIWGLVYPGKR